MAPQNVQHVLYDVYSAICMSRDPNQSSIQGMHIILWWVYIYTIQLEIFTWRNVCLFCLLSWIKLFCPVLVITCSLRRSLPHGQIIYSVGRLCEIFVQRKFSAIPCTVVALIFKMDTGIEVHFSLSVSYELLQPLPSQRLLLGGNQLLITSNTMKKLENLSSEVRESAYGQCYLFHFIRAKLASTLQFLGVLLMSLQGSKISLCALLEVLNQQTQGRGICP